MLCYKYICWVGKLILYSSIGVTSHTYMHIRVVGGDNCVYYNGVWVGGVPTANDRSRSRARVACVGM
jgi:hypothetical protein